MLLGSRSLLPRLLRPLWFGPGLRRRPLFGGRSCLLDRVRRRCLLYRPRRRSGSRLRCWVFLRGRPLLRSRAHWLRLPDRLGRGLDSRPRLWNLLGHPGWWLRSLRLPRLDRPRRRALLYRPHRDRLSPLGGQWLGHHYRLRASAVLRHKLGAVGAGDHPVLLLHPQLRQARLPQGG
jgi:hypothetical protein